MGERITDLFLHYGMSLFAVVPFVVTLILTIRARRVAKAVRELESRDEAAHHEVYEADLAARRYGIVAGLLGAVCVLAIAMTLIVPNARNFGEGGSSNPTLTNRTPPRSRPPITSKPR
ncbi:MAG: hypothetical protein U0174_14375 [Polyangiaceae bacterium]